MTASDTPVPKSCRAIWLRRAMQPSASPFLHGKSFALRPICWIPCTMFPRAGVGCGNPATVGAVRHLSSAFDVSEIDPRRDSL